MPIIALTMPVAMPVGGMRAQFKAALPLWNWCCGDDDKGGPDDFANFQRPQTIMARSSAGMVLMSIEERGHPLPPEANAPPHQLHLFLSQPSTEDAEMAKRMAVIAAASMMEQDPGSHCQLTADGRWYSAGEMAAALAFCTSQGSSERPIEHFFMSCGAPQPAAPAASTLPRVALGGLRPGPAEERMIMSDLEHSFAKVLTDIGGADFARSMGHAPPPPYAEEEPRIDRLPTFVFALSHPLQFDWAPMMDIGRLDPSGGWRVDPGPNGTAHVTGRGCTVRIEEHADPIPNYILQNALSRSFWFKGEAKLAEQRSALVLTCDLDTRAQPFEDVRETAKIITLLLGVLSRAPGCIALLNNGIHTLLDPQLVQSQVGHLHKNQIPLMLWTWTAPNSMVENSVSLTSGGLLPFLGYEVEVWNAPGTPEWVGERMSDVINYLLQAGPVVSDGDSFGATPGERSIRGFFGPSRAERWEQVQALMLEFDGPGRLEPRPDPLPTRDAPPAQPSVARGTAPEPSPDLMPLVALTRETVFPFNIVREMLERAFPGMRWTILWAQGNEPHQISGAGDEGKVEVAVGLAGLTLPRDLLPPPHRLYIMVSVGAHGDLALARRVALVVCSCLIIQLDEQAHFRLSVDGNWMSHDDALTAVSVPRHSKDIGDFDRQFGVAPEQFASARNPDDAYPVAPDDHFQAFRSIRAIAPKAVGAGLQNAMDRGLGRPDIGGPAAAPASPPVFGRRVGGFGRRGL